MPPPSCGPTSSAWFDGRGVDPGGCLGAICVAAVWILAQRYGGITGDARIYMGRALADLDPGGVGRDMMFAQDGQSAFSVFRIVARALVAFAGPMWAAFALALLNLVIWFVAMAWFARCYAKGRVLGVLLVCAAVLPCSYGFYPLMAAREIVAVPRPLGEAAVLLALAALCRGSALKPLALLAVAFVIHPIMALPGIGVFVVVQGSRDRRWVIAAAVGFVAALAAAMAGAPVLSRMTTIIDPEWRALLEDRNPYLFVSLWPGASFGPLLVQGITLAIGACLCEGRRRVVLLATLAVGLAGLASSWFFGDCLSLLLVVQAQPWRALWLVSVLAMPALGLCAVHLPRRGRYGQLALGCLALAWITFDLLPVAPVAAILAAILVALSRTRQAALSARTMLALGITGVAAAVVLKAPSLLFSLDFVRNLPPLRPDVVGPLWQDACLALPLIVVAVLWAARPGWRHETAAAAALAIVLAGAVAYTWDARTLDARQPALYAVDTGLRDRMAARPGEVLWLASDAPWYWLGRPQWNSFTQGSGIVFSRALAMQWRDRARLLIKLGLLDEDRMRPWRLPPKNIVPRLTDAAISGVCSGADAPAWIVAPLPAGFTPPNTAGASLWHAPVPASLGGVEDHTIRWFVFDTYVVVPCAGRGAIGPGASLDEASNL